MLRDLVDPQIATAEARTDEADGFLFRDERFAIRDAVQARRQEFATGRACAHRALEKLGRGCAPVKAGPSGEPLWPMGVVGSITHCDRYRGCAVARSSEFTTIGIDAEPNEPVPAAVRRRIVHDDDCVPGDPGGRQPTGVHWDRLLFSVKECVYKAWFPLTRRWLSFQDIAVELQCGGTFSAYVQTPEPLVGSHRGDTFSGRWSGHDGLLITAIGVERDSKS